MKLLDEELKQLIQVKDQAEMSQLVAENSNLRYQNMYLTLLLKHGATTEHSIDSKTGEIIVVAKNITSIENAAVSTSATEQGP